MKLVPVTGVLEAVTKAHDISPEGARMLVQFSLFEALGDLAETHRGEIEPIMLANMEKRLTGERQRLLRNTVGKSLAGDEDVDVQTAEYLAVLDDWVSKGLSDSLRQIFNRKHPRDPETGRFVELAAVSSGSPNNPPEARSNSSAHGAVSQAQRWRQAGLIDDDTPIRLYAAMQDETGRLSNTPRYADTTLKTMADDIKALGPGIQVTGVGLDRSKLPKMSGTARGAVDMIRTFSGADEITGRRLAQALPIDDQGKVKGQSLNAERWHGASNGTDRKGYRQLAMTGEALRRVSAPGTTPHTVGAMAQLSGELGPEAEKILGPGIRRTAYRFRGTERRPDREVVGQVKAATAMASGKAVPELDRGGKDYSVAAASTWARLSNEDQRHLRTVGDTAVAYLLGVGSGETHLPSRELTELSLESGEVPPSEGVLIDANGHVHSQSVGYNGDHYLPFDLKNLNGLYGGQYVRTRAAGGPSTEDLYTGLVAGARQIQVVSNSGVFTFEFDPDLRGGRRYSDKAKRMVQRYGELLDAIASGELYQTDLSPEKKAELRRQAADISNSEDEYRANYTQLERQARLKGSMSDDDDDAIEEGAENYARTKIQPERNQLQRADINSRMEELKREFREKHGPEVRRLRLDGPGYDRAMKALKQEFPYYLRNADYQSLPDWLSTRGLKTNQKLARHYAPDRGRVPAGQTNPNLPGHTDASRSLARRRHNAAAGEYKRAPKTEEGATATVATAASAAKPATPVAAATKAPEAAEVLANLKKPGSPYQRAVHQAIRESIRVFEQVEPPKGPPPEPADEQAALKMTPVDFTYWKYHQFAGKGAHAADEFATWLVNASEAEQYKVLSSIDGAKQAMAGYDVPGYSVDDVEQGYDTLKSLLALQHPFAEPEHADDPIEYLEQPSLDDPKPLALPDFPMGEKPEWYEQREKKLVAFEPATAAALVQIANVSDQSVASKITAKIAMIENSPDEATRKKYEQEAVALQRAWSFRTARGATQTLLSLAGGGAGPKAPEQGVSKARPRRVLMFHDVAGTSVAKSRRRPASLSSR